MKKSELKRLVAEEYRKINETQAVKLLLTVDAHETVGPAFDITIQGDGINKNLDRLTSAQYRVFLKRIHNVADVLARDIVARST